MQRRDLLKLLLCAPWLLPRTSMAGVMQPQWQRKLILIELKGGNDSLNTVIPYAEPRYYELRPTLAIAHDMVLQLTDSVGLHPALASLLPFWRDKELAIVQGLGYANPNLSHFRSIDIWHTGSDSDVVLEHGWLAQLFETRSPPHSFVADGIAIGNDPGPLAGHDLRSLIMRDPNTFIRQAQQIHAMRNTSNNEALAHLLQVQQEVYAAAQRLEERLDIDNAVLQRFPKSAIGRQLALAAQLIKGGIETPVIKLAHGSFDTHANQPDRHQNLLSQLAEALAAFRQDMQHSNNWNDVMIMTYSEFGRRPAENGNRGTDHGTAAAHFVLGGQIKGGLYGSAPSLHQLENNNLRYTLDYRHLYATAAKWWGLDVAAHHFSAYHALDLLRA